MTASELQRRVRSALETIGCPVTKDYSEFNGIYPHIAYREISNVPALNGDNREFAFRSTYQVAIVTNDDDYSALESAVEDAMIALGFVRSDAQDILDGDFNRVLRFTITTLKG